MELTNNFENIKDSVYIHDNNIIYNSKQLELCMYTIIKHINDIRTLHKYNINNMLRTYRYNKQLMQYKNILNTQVIYILYLMSKVNKSLKNNNLITSSTYCIIYSNHNYGRLLRIIKMIDYLENMIIPDTYSCCSEYKPNYIAVPS
jgi:hypothetical protein